MAGSLLALALPCPKCKATAGNPCVRLDGQPRSGSHVRRTPPAPCGTYGGYQRHLKSGEATCSDCREAARLYRVERRRTHPEEREKDMAGLRAIRRATNRLVDLHRDEWRALVAEEKAAI